MKTIAVSEAFGNAPPRSAAVVCVNGTGDCTDLMLADWFTWLNIKRNPMISFSLPRKAEIAARLREGDTVVLAIPPLAEAKRYEQALSAAADRGNDSAEAGSAEIIPAEDTAKPVSDRKPETVAVKGLPVRVPKGSRVLLRCTIAGAYNYPFKKVRIFNCNLEEALGSTKDLLD